MGPAVPASIPEQLSQPLRRASPTGSSPGGAFHPGLPTPHLQPPRGHCPENLGLCTSFLGRVQMPHLDRSTSSPVYIPDPATLLQRVSLSLSQPSGVQSPCGPGGLSCPWLASSPRGAPLAHLQRCQPSSASFSSPLGPEFSDQLS